MKVGFCVMFNYELYDWEIYNIYVKYIVYVCFLYKFKFIVFICLMYLEFLIYNELYGLRIVVKYNDLSKRVYKKNCYINGYLCEWFEENCIESRLLISMVV